MVCARSELNRCTPCRRPPTRNPRPSTSRMFDRIEPMMRGLHDGDQPSLKREEADEQLRQVAQRALQHTRRTGPEPVTELLDAAPNQRGQQRNGEPGDHEREHRGRAGIARHARGGHRHGPARDHHNIGSGETADRHIDMIANPRPPGSPSPFRRSWSCGWHKLGAKRHKGNHNSKIDASWAAVSVRRARRTPARAAAPGPRAPPAAPSRRQHGLQLAEPARTRAASTDTGVLGEVGQADERAAARVPAAPREHARVVDAEELATPPPRAAREGRGAPARAAGSSRTRGPRASPGRRAGGRRPSSPSAGGASTGCRRRAPASAR